jgi:hypothetical protein
MNQMLSALIDINRLEKEAVQAAIRDFPLQEILPTLRSEIAYAATDKARTLEVPESATSPADAYTVLEHLTSDPIITDFHLNHKESGVDIVRGARERTRRFISAILATGDTGRSMGSLGIDDVHSVSEPVDAAVVLIALVQRLRESRRPSQAIPRKARRRSHECRSGKCEFGNTPLGDSPTQLVQPHICMHIARGAPIATRR